MKVIDAIFRFVLGVVFLFSGYVKAVDPLGMYYKIGDYLIAYDLTALQPLAMLGAISIIGAEVLLGVFFLFNLYPKFSIWSMLFVESTFTVLTLVSWITNAVSDCGCFGDAVELTNAETFWKNIALMVLVLWLWVRRNEAKGWFAGITQFAFALLFLLLTLGFQWYNYNHLPIHDFRPYHVGADIKKQMELPENAKQDVYLTKLYYEKDGVVKEFTEQNYPWQDSTWVFKDTKVELIEKGDEAPIHDFSIMTPDGDDLLPIILDNPGYKFVVVSYRLDRANQKAFKELKALKKWSDQEGINFVPLTSSTPKEITELNKAVQGDYVFYATDQTTLKTIIRSNPGLLLIKGSKIVGKWHYNDLPSVDKIKSTIKN